jgi:Holliday junction DNA helicase RuvA
MIGRLRGRVEEVDLETCLIDVGGVMYELTCPASTLGDLQVGSEVVVDVHTHVREDQLTLFGFSSRVEKTMFLALLGVNGVGPKMAVKILSGAPLSEIARWIEMGDVKSLSGLPKVGKKTAEQLIVSLKGKLGDWATGSVRMGQARAVGAMAMPLKGQDEIASALSNLGFRGPELERVMQQLSPDVSFEDGVREALRLLGGAR